MSASDDDEPASPEPRVRRFLELLAGAAPSGDKPSLAEIREAARRARLPLNEGGPAVPTDQPPPVEAAGRRIAIRRYRPAGSSGATLVYLHGGGWTLLGLDTHDRLMREYAAASGWQVIALDYPLAPESTFPTTVEVCAAALCGILRLAPALGIDPRHLTLGGDSAGANLALAVALAGLAPALAGLVLSYGVYDGSAQRASYRAFGRPPYQLTPVKMAWFWDNYCPEVSLRDHPLASPLRADVRGLPPVLAVIAGHDILRDENRALVRRLATVGVPVRAEEFEGMPHGFLEAIDLLDESPRAIALTGAWLRALPPVQAVPNAKSGAGSRAVAAGAMRPKGGTF